MSIPDWQRRRSEFNHQWLKNRLLSALDAADQILRGRAKGFDYLRELMTVEAPEWMVRKADLVGLLQDFEEQMSPQALFNHPPLSQCEVSTKMAFAPLVHELWLARLPIKERLAEIRIAAEGVDASYISLLEVPMADSEGKLNPEFSTRFEEFRSYCHALASAIEKLPNRILVT
jgi:hypothetical protein